MSTYAQGGPAAAAPPARKAEAEAIVEITRTALQPHKHPHADGLPFIVLPDGCNVETLPIPGAPQRHSGTVRLHDAESFIAYTKLYANAKPEGGSAIYACADPAKFIAVLNDHEHAEPNWRDWRAEFAVTASREWKTWTAANRKQMSQLGFAEFLEDNLPDIVAPDSTDLLQMVLNFEATKGGAFKSVQRLSNGDVNFSWVDETSGGGTVTMPTQIVLTLPVFERGAAYSQAARLKYRVKDGALTLWFELVRPHKTLEVAFEALRAQVAEQTKVPVYMGEP